MNMLANILRTGILAASAALPENAVIANVVFASSMQILIAVGYSIIFTIVTASYRVLSTREAMQDPSSVKDVEFYADDDINGELELESDHEERPKHVRRSRLLLLRDLRDKLQGEADRLASHIFLQRGELSHKPIETATDASCDENFSVSSHDEIVMAKQEPVTPHFNTVAPAFTNHTHDRADTAFEDNTEINIYSDVYALGISLFIMHYCLDAASMNPTLFLLIGLTILALKDEICVSRDEVNYGKQDESLIFVKGLSVSAFLLIVAAQICILVGIARVPTYHTSARDGGILQVPAPDTVLEMILAVFFPMLAPGTLYFIRRRKSANHVSRLLRTALPCTVIVALWFITCFGAMNEQIRTKLGVESVNVTIATFTQIDNAQLPVLLVAPFFKVPALLCIISCCLSGKTIDIVCSLALIFYVKQYNAVRDGEMHQMLLMGLIFAAFAWSMCTLRYWKWFTLYITNFFSR